MQDQEKGNGIVYGLGRFVFMTLPKEFFVLKVIVWKTLKRQVIQVNTLSPYMINLRKTRNGSLNVLY